MVDRFRDFLGSFDQASKGLQILLQKHKTEIGSTMSEDNLFSNYYEETIAHPIRKFRISISFENNKACIFLIETFQLQVYQFNFTEIVELNHSEI